MSTTAHRSIIAKKSTVAQKSTVADKSAMHSRGYFTRQRRALTKHNRQQMAKQASLQLHKLRGMLPKNAKVAIYYDDFGELATQVILDWCIKLGYQAYLPVVSSLRSSSVNLVNQHNKRLKNNSLKNKQLRFAPIDHHKLLNLPTRRHTLGMKQPYKRLLLPAAALDMIICPLVAIDKAGTRMGMGGGYYDTTLAKFYQLSIAKPLKVAWCYDFQLVDKLNKQTWDVPMDMIISNKGLKRINNALLV